MMCCLNISFADSAASSKSLDDVRERLETPFMKGLLTRTYQSLVQRAHPDGYFQESLTGAYDGMFPRTVGAVGRLFLETGELDKLESILSYCLKAMLDNDMERIPHVIAPRRTRIIPILGKDDVGFLGNDIPFAKLIEKFGAAQDFVGNKKPLKALELYVGNLLPGETIIAEIHDSKGVRQAIATRRFDKAVGSSWVRLEFPSPVKLVSGKQYRVVLRAEKGAVNPVVYAGLSDDENPFRAFQIDDSRYTDSSYNLSMVFDYGSLKHRQNDRQIGIISKMDQIDGQAHVIMAWAMLARHRGETDFENRTYPVVAKLMDRSTTEPYLFPHVGARIKIGLVCNVTFEHSRDGQYWHAYDFLTQSFICSALENMIEVAQRRQDTKSAERWTRRLKSLTTNIMQNMTRNFEGRKIFYEMILPTGRTPEPFPGIGWLNLAPIPAGWKGIDKQVFKNTIDAWHRVAGIEWDGPRMTSSDWLPEGETDVFGRRVSNQVIGKVLGWDLVYCLRAREYDRVCEMLDFIEKINSPELYAEAFNYDSNTKKWVLQDPGNGEQATWWCWAMVNIREKVGLPPLPVKD